MINVVLLCNFGFSPIPSQACRNVVMDSTVGIEGLQQPKCHWKATTVAQAVSFCSNTHLDKLGIHTAAVTWPFWVIM